MAQVKLKSRENTLLDIFRVLACVLVVTIHMPEMFSTEWINVFWGEWLVRFAVPFFFVCTGFFFEQTPRKGSALKRMAWLMAFAYVLYLPAVLEGAEVFSQVLSKLRWNLVIGYEHLWYISACVESMILWILIEKVGMLSKIFQKVRVPTAVGLILLGALLDEHYRLSTWPLLHRLGDFLLNFGGPRNFLFMGFPLMLLGGAIAEHVERVRRIPLWGIVSASIGLWILAFLECGWLYTHLGSDISNDLSFFGWMPALCLVVLSLKCNLPISERLARSLRRATLYVYILHPLMAMLIGRYLVLSPVALCLATLGLCFAVAFLLEKQFAAKRP